jgi:hypothetical protein
VFLPFDVIPKECRQVDNQTNNKCDKRSFVGRQIFEPVQFWLKDGEPFQADEQIQAVGE